MIGFGFGFPAVLRTRTAKITYLHHPNAKEQRAREDECRPAKHARNFSDWQKIEKKAGAERGKFETVKGKVSEVAGNLKAGAVKKAEQLKEKAEQVCDEALHKVR